VRVVSRLERLLLVQAVQNPYKIVSRYTISYTALILCFFFHLPCMFVRVLPTVSIQRGGRGGDSRPQQREG